MSSLQTDTDPIDALRSTLVLDAEPETKFQRKPIPKKFWLSSALPTLPSAAVELLEIAQDPEIEISMVVDAIKNDPALTARLLRACNSAFFSFRSTISSLERAVPLLGLQSVTSLVLGFSLSNDSIKDGPLASYYKTVWTQSLAQAVAAEMLGERFSGMPAGITFQMGLLLDIGALAMLKTMPDEYLEILEEAEQEDDSLRNIELRTLGFGHCEVGEKLAQKWRLPEMLQLAIGRHHGDSDEVSSSDPEEDMLLQVAAMSSAIGDYLCRPAKGIALKRIRQLMSDGFPMSEPEVNDVIAKIQKRVEDCRQMFQIPCHDLPSAGDLMALANEQLSELAFRAQVEREAAVQQQQVFEAQNRHLQEKQLQLVEESSRDPLTGAFNRRFFLDSLNREASRCQRDAASIGLLFIDVDHFKTFNDTYGHAAGDLVLKLVSDAITESLRGSDMACRYGGEEFVVLVNRPTRTTLELVGSRIREQIENAKLEFEGKQLHVTASLGASIGIPEQFATEFVDELIATADAAMYDAKKSGRNRLCLRTMLSSTK